MLPTYTRRLITCEQVAYKLGMSANWFYRNRKYLYLEGFPLPVFGRARHGQARYDEKAIDLWLDTHMSKDLLSLVDEQKEDIDRDIDNRLGQIITEGVYAI